MNRLKVGVILDDWQVEEEMADFVEWVIQHERIDLACIVLQGKPNLDAVAQGPVHRSIVWLQRLPFRVLSRLERTFLSRTTGLKFDQTLKIHAENLPIDTRVIVASPNFTSKPLVARYTLSDVGAIKDTEADVLIRGSSGILRGDILDSVKFGVLSFHHGDNRVYRGLPPGFWEVQHKRPSTGFVIQQLTEELDGGNVLIRGSFRTQSYYTRNRISVTKRSQKYLLRLLDDLSSTGELPTPEPSRPFDGSLVRTPDWTDIFLYVARQVRRVAGRSLRRRGPSTWSVRMSQSSWRDLVLWKGTNIEADSNKWLADPFVVLFGNRRLCFVEEYCDSEGKASIAVYESREGSIVRLGTAIREPFHVSFPHVFQDSGDWFLCPETCDAKDVRIYKAVDFPLVWELHAVLLSDIHAADSLVLKGEDRWFLLTSVLDSIVGDDLSELTLFCADRLDGAWSQCSTVPVVCDPNGARNGGLILDGSDFYRVGQCHEFGKYGTSLKIFRIVNLSCTGYKEELVAQIKPEFGKSVKGVHHLSSVNGLSAFDFSPALD